MRGSFDDYYMSLVEIKKINVFIFNTPSFNQPVKNKHEAYKRFVEMSNNNDYTTGNLLNHSYHQKSFKFTGILAYLCFSKRSYYYRPSNLS